MDEAQPSGQRTGGNSGQGNNTLRYLKLPWRSLSDHWGHTLFAIFSVVVGVAIIVVMLNLSEIINRSTVSDARLRLHADLLVELDEVTTDLAFFEALQAEGLITNYTGSLEQQVQIRSGAASSLVTAVGVEPGVYPLYGELPLLDEAGNFTGTDGASLLTTEDTAVLTSNAFDRLGLDVGDEVLLVNDGSTTVRVQGTTPPAGPVPLSFDSSTIFGFIVLDKIDAAIVVGEPAGSVNRVYLQLADEANLDQVMAQISQHAPTWEMLSFRQVAEQTGSRLEVITQLLRYVGLLSLLVGGVGVAHTVQANFSRRHLQIAMLKAMGFRTRQIFLQLSLEALWIGLLGSILGIGLGLLASWASIRLVEGFIFQSLTFQVSTFAVIAGLMVGTLTILVFSILPILSASRARPADLFRHTESDTPTRGRSVLLLALLPLVLALGIMSGIILGDMGQGVIFAFGLFIVCGLLILLLVGLLWLISHLPHFRSPILGLTLTNIGRQRRRAATAVLAFTVGIFAVGTITVLAENARSGINQVWQQAVAYDLIAFVPVGEDVAAIADDLREHEEVTAVDQSRLSRLTLDAINDAAADTFLDTYQAAIREAGIIGMMNSVEGRDLTHPLPDKHLESGRMLTAADTGQPVAIVSSLIAETVPLDIGSTITFVPDSGEPFTLEIVGIYREMGWSVGGTGLLTSIETIAAADDHAGAVLRIKANPEIEDSNAAIAQIINQRYPMLFVLESQELLYSFTSLLDTLSIFPTLVAFLSLFAGAVIVANNVILALLDRRSEIGILKAVGIRRGKVLLLLLLENGLFGFIGSTLGLLLAVLAAYLVTSQGLLGESVAPVFNGATITAVLSGGLFIVFLTTILATWSTVQARPLAVLRNE